MSQANVLGTAGIDTSALAVRTPTTTLGVTLPTNTLSGTNNTEHNLILKRLDEIKTAINDGFSQMATKINEMGIKHTGGRRRLRKKQSRITAKNRKSF
jgi:hypothetical protein